MLMCSEKISRIRIKDAISSDLALRDSANSFFDLIESKKFSDDIQVDFSDIKSISRSFAHQYLQRKSACKKEVEEINVPENISKMFEIIKNQDEKKSFIKRSSVRFICL